MILLSELQMKETVYMHNGERIGYVDDIEINEATGEIVALIVKQTESKMPFRFQRQPELIISWDEIATIGTDIILIRESNINGK